MTSPRTPRQLLGWTVPDHIAVTEGEGNYYLRCEHGHVGTSMTVSQFMGTDRFVRGFLQDHAHGETVELLSEVLPETPEPPQEDRQLLGWIVPDHIGWVETDGYVEITCRAVAGECSQTTSVQNREWIEEFLTKHAHGQPVKRCPVPASQSVPAVPVSSTSARPPMTGSGFVWSQLAACMDAGSPCPPLAGTTPLAPQPVRDQTYTGPLTALPSLDLDEDPPTSPPAQLYPGESVPGRRGWLLRAIEGIFG